MKVFVQIIDTKTGIYQTGMIEEPVKSGLEIDNALKHFGVINGEVSWFYNKEGDFNIKNGEISGTTKIVSVVTL